MTTPVSSIIRRCTKDKNESLNILTSTVHERFETNLSKTNNNFYAWSHPSLKKWEIQYAPIPNNYTILDESKGDDQLLPWVDIDLVLNQSYGTFSLLSQVAQQLSVPLINLEHVLPNDEWDQNIFTHIKNMKGNVKVFLSEYSREKWGHKPGEAEVILQGTDTEFFKPLGLPRNRYIISAVNKWVERDRECGYTLWKHVTEGLPVHPIGDTPGLSTAVGPDDLVIEYNKAQIFINTSLVSSFPMSLIESMSCGCPAVSTATSTIPEVIKNGYNGYITNDPKLMRYYLEELLNNPKKCEELGNNARESVIQKFSLEKFIINWNNLFRKASEINL